MSVAKGWDELWVEVICQSNPEIAGSPRNIFKYSLLCSTCGVEILNGRDERKRVRLTKLRIRKSKSRGVRLAGLSRLV